MKRTFAILACILAPLLCALLIGGGLFFSFLNQKPDELAKRLSSRLTLPEYGLSLSMGTASLTVFPKPSVKLSDLVVRTANTTLFVEHGVLFPDLWSLLQGDLRLSGIQLASPSLFLETDSAQKAEPLTFPALPPQIQGMDLEMENASITALPSSPDRFSLPPVWRITGLSGNGELPGKHSAGQLNLAAARMEYYGGTPPQDDGKPVPVHQLDKAELNLAELEYAPPQPGKTLPTLRGRIECRVPLALEKTAPHLVVGITVKPEDDLLSFEGVASLDGTFSLRNQPIPIRALLPFSTEISPDALAKGTFLPLRFKGASLSMEKDKAVFNGDLLFPDANGRLPSLKGTLEVQQLSLPRWFSFGRDLPSGIQQALDQLQGTLVFELNPQRLAVTSATATAAKVLFKGTGGVGDFAKPVVSLNLSAKNVPLDRIFPLAEKKSIPAPSYNNPPLLGGDDDDTPAPGYDIRLGAERATFWKWTGNSASVRITPESSSKTGQARVAVRCDSLYGGSARADIISGDALSLNLSAEKINAESFLTPLTGTLFRKGTMNGSASLTAIPTSPELFLSTLKGKAEVLFENGELLSRKAGRPSLPFTRLGLSFQGSGSRTSSSAPRYAYSGDWQCSLATTEGQGTLNLDGALQFPVKGPFYVAADNVPASGKASIAGFSGQGEGILSLNTQSNTIGARNLLGHISTGNASVTLNGTVNGTQIQAQPEWEAELTLATSSLRELLRKKDILPELPAHALNSAQAKVRFRQDASGIRFSELDGMIDETRFSGSVEGDRNTPPHWTADIRLGTLQLSDYLPSGNRNAPAAAWNTGWLKGYELEGKLEIAKLIIAGMTHEEVNIPLAIKGGILTCDPIRGRIAGGSLGAGLRIEAITGGLLSRLRYTLRSVNVLTLSRERKQTQLISGIGSLDADVSGLLHSGADIPAALNGTLGFFIKDGSLDAQHPGPLNRFTVLSATGKLNKGVLSTQDLNMSGGLSVRGSGSINLVSQTLNYMLTATGPGIPEIPVHYYGSLSNPQRSFNATGILANTLNSLGSGALGILDTVLFAPLRLLAP